VQGAIRVICVHFVVPQSRSWSIMERMHPMDAHWVGQSARLPLASVRCGENHASNFRAGESDENRADHRLLNQKLFEESCDEFTREMNRLRMEHRASFSAAEREIERIEVR
jgi:hypothetical protein